MNQHVAALLTKLVSYNHPIFKALLYEIKALIVWLGSASKTHLAKS